MQLTVWLVSAQSQQKFTGQQSNAYFDTWEEWLHLDCYIREVNRVNWLDSLLQTVEWMQRIQTLPLDTVLKTVVLLLAGKATNKLAYRYRQPKLSMLLSWVQFKKLYGYVNCIRNLVVSKKSNYHFWRQPSCNKISKESTVSWTNKTHIHQIPLCSRKSQQWNYLTKILSNRWKWPLTCLLKVWLKPNLLS